MPSPQKKATITSLAHELNLSICTVSKILSRSLDGFSCSQATIARVEALALKRGYVANRHARSLRTNRSMTIGLAVPSGIPYFSGTLVECIEGELRKHGYETLVGHSTAETQKEIHLIRTMLERGIDGLLWIPFSDQLRPKDFAIPAKYPLVVLDRPGCGERFPTVMTDNRAASRNLAAEIASTGICQVAIFTSDCGDRSLSEREEGVREVFKNRVSRHQSTNEMAAARAALQTILPKLKGKTLICLSQTLALGALQAIREHNWRIGVDLGFACFDHLPFCDIWHPSLCRIEQDIEALGQEGARLLIEKILRPEVKHPREIRIPARLIPGTSAIPQAL